MFSMPTHPPGRPVHQTYADDFATFELADRLGYDEVWIGEHFTSVWENIPDPLAFIAGAAARTRRLRFGTGVLLMPFHNPLYAALRLAQLDHQTLGRIQVGIGSGGLTADKAIFGLDHTPEQAASITREGIELLLRCWEGEPLEFEGEHFRLKAGEARPQVLDGVLMRPYQQPHPPIAIAGNTRGSYALRNAGARGWIPMSAQFLAESGLESHWGAYAAGAAEAGRLADRGLWRISRDIHVAETSQQARAEAREGGISRTYTDYFLHVFNGNPRALDWFKDDPSTPDEAVDIDFLREKTFIVGSPDEVVEKVCRLHERVGGFGYLMQVAHDWWPNQPALHRSMELLATRVLPQLPA
jgi:alkanesulfonate monooxygenase SsuD/methylene tetrahydromethanopterin reductase-like flavin-dependent oxidoreductase (luciferase family)